MLSSSTRRFDLYDFFSVFLPGATFVLGLLPFAPRETNIGSAGVLLPIVISGFVVGRAIHSAANTLDAMLDNQSHRDLFVSELKNPDECFLQERVVSKFYSQVNELFDEELGLPDERQDLNRDQCLTLYGLVRSYIHIDSRGRSRTFQAVYSFYRSTWLVTVLLFGVYFLYGVLRVLGVTQGLVNYGTFASSLGIPPLLISLGSVVAITFSYKTIRDAKEDHQEHFIRYLISDFLVLRDSDSQLEPGDPTTPSGEQQASD